VKADESRSFIHNAEELKLPRTSAALVSGVCAGANGSLVAHRSELSPLGSPDGLWAIEDDEWRKDNAVRWQNGRIGTRDSVTPDARTSKDLDGLT